MELCEAAWAAFQEIEAEGGLVDSLRNGKLQARVANIRAQREEKIAHRQIELTGTSAVSQSRRGRGGTLDVPRRKVEDVIAARMGSGNADLADLARAGREGSSSPVTSADNTPALNVDALPSVRDSEPFEALRDAADAATAAGRDRPRVFLGQPRSFGGARHPRDWIGNLLAAGGIDAEGNDGFTNSADAGKAFAESGAAIACICGTDETYGQLADATAGGTQECRRSEGLPGRPRR